MLTPDEQLEAACLISEGPTCRVLELIAKYRDENTDLKEWNKILQKQLERYKDEKNYPDN